MMKSNFRNIYFWRLICRDGNVIIQNDSIDPNNPPCKIIQIDLQPKVSGYPECLVTVPDGAKPVFFFRNYEQLDGKFLNMQFFIGYDLNGNKSLLCVDGLTKRVSLV